MSPRKLSTPSTPERKRSRFAATVLASGLWLLYFDLFTSAQGCADSSTPSGEGPPASSTSSPASLAARAVYAHAADRMPMRAQGRTFIAEGPHHRALVDELGGITFGAASTPAKAGEGIALSTAYVRRGDRDLSAGAFDLRFANGDVLIHRGTVDESIIGTPMGVEQSWSFEERPSGSGDLSIAVAIAGAKVDHFDERGLLLEGAGGRRLVVGYATWVDAHGVRTRADAQWTGSHLVFRLPESVLETSHFPMSIAPSIEAITTAAVGDTCGALTTGASPASPQAAGTLVDLTGAATCTGTATPEYQFYFLPPGGTWALGQAYSPSGTFQWNTAGRAGGTYSIQVRSRAQGSTAAYDAVRTFTFELTGGAGACTSLSVNSTPPGPQVAGTPVTITGASTCSVGAAAEYQFYLLSPGGAWALAQSYSPTATFDWNTATASAGTYSVQVRTRAVGSTAAYDAVKTIQYEITGGVGACNTLTTGATPASPQGAGTLVSLSGNATCTGAAQPEYQFYLLPPGGYWTLARSYASSATFDWNTTGAVNGTYTVQVRARAQGSGRTYDSVSSFQFTVTGGAGSCAGLTTSTSPPGTATTGTVVSVNAAATCTGGATPVYQFYYLPPGGYWTLGQAYSASSTFAWNTAGAPPGTYTIQVRSRASTSTTVYEGLSVTSYQLTIAPAPDSGVFDAPPIDGPGDSGSVSIDSALIDSAPIDSSFDSPPSDSSFIVDASPDI